MDSRGKSLFAGRLQLCDVPCPLWMGRQGPTWSLIMSIMDGTARSDLESHCGGCAATLAASVPSVVPTWYNSAKTRIGCGCGTARLLSRQKCRFLPMPRPWGRKFALSLSWSVRGRVHLVSCAAGEYNQGRHSPCHRRQADGWRIHAKEWKRLGSRRSSGAFWYNSIR